MRALFRVGTDVYKMFIFTNTDIDSRNFIKNNGPGTSNEHGSSMKILSNIFFCVFFFFWHWLFDVSRGRCKCLPFSSVEGCTRWYLRSPDYFYGIMPRACRRILPVFIYKHLAVDNALSPVKIGEIIFLKHGWIKGPRIMESLKLNCPAKKWFPGLFALRQLSGIVTLVVPS